jgi:SAM-dependent methyltransferase
MADWPDFSERSRATEWMDDFDITDERLRSALHDLRLTNRLLGAYTATDAALDPLLRRRDALTVLDLGCGIGDYLARFVRRGPRFGCVVRAVGVDANPVTVGHARAFLDAQLPGPLRSRARAEIGDALALPYQADAFDVTHAALFLHHLHGPDAPALLREMDRVGRAGLIINDLHRHPLAWTGIWILSRALRMAPMVQHDGPLSVRRGFRRDELARLARDAALPSPRIRWHWAFRWTLSTLQVES